MRSTCFYFGIWWMTRSYTLFHICVHSNKRNYKYKQPYTRQSWEWLVKRNRPTCACCKFYFCSLSPFAWNLVASNFVTARLINNIPYAELVIQLIVCECDVDFYPIKLSFAHLCIYARMSTIHVHFATIIVYIFWKASRSFQTSPNMDSIL